MTGVQTCALPISEVRVREVLAGVKAEITGGSSLAAALGVYQRDFPDFYRALVHGGEESGALPTVLQHLADYLDAREELRQKTTLALLYPALVTGVALAIVAGLLVYVVPQVVQVFQQSRQSLPLLTRALIGLSDFLRIGWPYLLLMMVGIGIAARAALRNPSHAFASKFASFSKPKARPMPGARLAAICTASHKIVPLPHMGSSSVMSGVQPDSASMPAARFSRRGASPASRR